ncbi:4a-hydroxytetrahydrobiopterin dehydratase [Carboxylicivirga sediminis]|uniref:Putative pterin-4-alpha-carbinolamine dehydratase n=1 Tax=Carboxylicivirga sediminis TaxID=2006564 RepID=A0A941F7V0_9BACT|nr:4a-hydroxytetrahydrobiopterin dehydratase [Carboxylicivirga sediminis]MBR8538338.1 4a-hydroxytetrahydrobiopterin dehydratase [Carboxylicivirga sediminis]
MGTLDHLKCEACSVNAHRLSADEIASLMPDVPHWELIEDGTIQKLKRVFRTDNFIQSIALTNAIAEQAEKENHHPQLIVEYSSVTVIWWTHKIHGLHKNDFIMAYHTSTLYANMAG